MAKIYVLKTNEKVEIVVEKERGSLKELKEVYDQLSRELGMPKTVFMGPRAISGFSSGCESKEASSMGPEINPETWVENPPPMEAKKPVDKRKRRK